MDGSFFKKSTTSYRWHPPMLATLVKKPFSKKGWVFERKLDGIRCLVYKKRGKATLYSRNKKSLNQSYPELVSLFTKLPEKDFVMDGEIISFKKGKTSFSQLQNRMHVKTPSQKQLQVAVDFFAFDLLFLKKYDLRSLPLVQRKSLLRKHFSFKGKLHFTNHVKTQGKKLYQKACKMRWEGVIAKKEDSPYLSRRTKNWQKFKCENRQEFVIAGFTSPQGSRIGFGALIVGYYAKKKLQYAGKVGTGYSHAFLQKLGKNLMSLLRKKPHFAHQKVPKNIHYVTPKLVCEVAFTEWTKDKKLRHPRFLGLRYDKKPQSVIKE